MTFLRSFSHSDCTVLTNGAGWQVTGDMVPQEHQIIHDIESCLSLQWGSLTYFAAKNLEAGAAGEGDKRDQREFDHHTFLNHQAVLHILLLPLLSPIPSSPPNPFSPPSEGLEGLQALPSLVQEPVGQDLGFLHRGLASSSPQVPK